MTNYYMGQKVLSRTELFGKTYFWMEDGDGTVYLTKAKPVISGSVDGQTGEGVPFISHWVPDFS